MNHANRSKTHGDDANPSVEELVAFRNRYKLTQAEAAKLAMSSLRSWAHWESGERRMHPAIWAWVKHAVQIAPDTVDDDELVEASAMPALSLQRLSEISKRLHEDSSNDAANFNELYEVLEMLGLDPENGK